MSKFTSAINAARERKDDPIDIEALEPAVAPPRPRVGRPAGKRSSESTTQVTAYIEAETHAEVKIQLIRNGQRGGKKQDFSSLVQELLDGWLKVQN